MIEDEPPSEGNLPPSLPPESDDMETYESFTQQLWKAALFVFMTIVACVLLFLNWKSYSTSTNPGKQAIRPTISSVNIIDPQIYQEIETVKQGLDNAKTQREYDQIVSKAQHVRLKPGTSFATANQYESGIDQLRAEGSFKRGLLPP